ncbi:conserved hypothetical protein [Vibrio phage 150E35-1]|nr:conserved hypothetical protein [Vibrio phage 150E35-1]
MPKLYKNGSIVPKYLMRTVVSKQQHVLKFGCDVMVEGRKITPVTAGSIFLVPYVETTRHKRKSCRKPSVRKWQGTILDKVVEIDFKGLPFTNTAYEIQGASSAPYVPSLYDSRIPSTSGSQCIYDNLE